MKNVAIVDGGVGGLCALAKLYWKLGGNYLYIADSANFPLFERDVPALRKIAESHVKRAVEWGADAVVFTDAALSCYAARSLCGKFDEVEIFGAEPPLKQAEDYSVSGAVALANCKTMRFCQGRGLRALDVSPLAEMVESGAKRQDELAFLEKALAKEGNFDCVVLADAHFGMASDVVAQLYPAVKVFDSTQGLVGKLCRQKKRKSAEQGAVDYIVTANEAENRKKFEKILQKFFK